MITPELNQQYTSMINHVINDNTAEAQVELSAILASKLADKMRDYNAQLGQLNHAALNPAPTPAE